MPQQEEPLFENWKRNFNFAFFICLLHQRAVTLPARRGWGINALGLPCVLAFVLMFIWATLTQDALMWGYLGIWTLYFMKRRSEALKLVRQGEHVHSEYDGWPCDAIRYCGSERMAKRVVEPILVGIMGGLLFWGYGQYGLPVKGLPAFLLTGCLTLPFVESVKQTIWDRRIQSMMDFRMQQEAMMADFRNRYHDN